MNYYTNKGSDTDKKIRRLYKKKLKAIKFKEAFYKKYKLIILFNTKLDMIGLYLKRGLLKGAERPNIPNFRRIGKYYYPNKKTKEGKLILKEFDSFEKITLDELKAIGIKEYTINDIFANDWASGVMSFIDSGIEIPNDCIKIEDEVFLQYFPNSKDSFLPF